MATLRQVLLTLLLVYFALTDGTVTTTNIDFAGTYQGNLSNLLSRVEKTVDVRYNYVISSQNRWTQFPDMAIEFDLQFPQYVTIEYNIWTYTGAENGFYTRVTIDDVERRVFRISTANDWYHSHVISRDIWMNSGHHNAKVLYKAQVGRSINENWDMSVAIFNIRYFKK